MIRTLTTAAMTGVLALTLTAGIASADPPEEPTAPGTNQGESNGSAEPDDPGPFGGEDQPQESHAPASPNGAATGTDPEPGEEEYAPENGEE